MRKEEEEYGVKEQQGKVWLAKTGELGEEGEESEEAPHGCSEGSCWAVSAKKTTASLLEESTAKVKEE